MYAVRTLRKSPVPLVLLSATVPMYLEQEMKIAFSSDFISIRPNTTTRRELRYSVFINDSILDTLIDRLRNSDLRQSPGIIFCQTKAECTAVAMVVSSSLNRNCFVYHSGLSPGEKKQVQDSFLKDVPEPSIMVCTSAFGVGVDKPNIRFVYHHRLPSSILDYVQECGRAARGSDFIGDCCAFTSEEDFKDIAWKGEKDEKSNQLAQEIIAYAKVYNVNANASYAQTSDHIYFHSRKDVEDMLCIVF